MVPDPLVTNTTGMMYDWIVITNNVVNGTQSSYGSNWFEYTFPPSEKLESKRSATAVPPQPPPVALELACSRLSFINERDRFMFRPVSLKRPLILRLFNRQSVPTRTRRRIRTWER